MGRHQQAIAELTTAATDKNADGEILEHLGDVYQKTNQPDKALDTWNRAAKAYERDARSKPLPKLREKIRKASEKKGS